ncbi:MAG: tetratricopeptide repeat protein [Candidatus Margulisbacteria bacterium]|nr:tetratricopeptide repeat protein [Candidatus Margulisiibacteriota bacterium]MBU1022016.1 tetratricopeptide repeat protein [Candidatus Margulisiibacteriota bacterium]MBU1729861.1 tetratricopeptide repeat protein [Candidatus Margulisiibacteriota bacterium]MBU1955191.1 tetratricopeptide repeat protein [Candidatus Margulisiibacteriota bacterium]
MKKKFTVILIGLVLVILVAIGKCFSLGHVPRETDQTSKIEENTQETVAKLVLDEPQDNYYLYHVLLGIYKDSQRDPEDALTELASFAAKYEGEDVSAYDTDPLKGAFGAMAQMLKARIYAEKGDIRKALVSYEYAISRYGDIEIIGEDMHSSGPFGKTGAFALLCIANIYFDKPEKSLETYHRLIRQYPKAKKNYYEGGGQFDVEAFRKIVRITEKKYSSERVIIECNQVLRESKNEELICKVLLTKARKLAELNKTRESIETFQEIITKYPEVKTYYYPSREEHYALTASREAAALERKIEDEGLNDREKD